MEKAIEMIGNVPGAVWIVAFTALVIAAISIAKSGKNKYGMSFFLSLSMLCTFVGFLFFSGTGLYLGYFYQSSGVPENVMTNTYITLSVGILFVAYAIYRNVKVSNILFGIVYSIFQVLFCSFIFLGIAFKVFIVGDTQKKKLSYQ